MLRRPWLELLEYLATSVGMALACSAYLMVSELQTLAPGYTHWILAIAAGLCAVLSLSIGELASMFPSAPGVRTYVRAGLGDGVSLFCTFGVLMVVLLFAGVECHALLLCLRPWLSGAADLWMASALVVTITLVNLAGLELPQLLQLLLTAVILVALGASSETVLARHEAPAVPSASPLNLALGVGGAVFIFTGFEWVTSLGRTPKSYAARIPWSMPIALLVLAGSYALLAAAFGRSGHVAEGLVAPHMRVAELAWGGVGTKIMAAVSVASLFTTFNAGMMGASRLVYALAREGKLPAFAKTVSTRSGAPVGAIWSVGLAVWAACLLVLGAGLERTAMLVCAALYCLVYAGFLLAAARLRRTSPQLPRPFRSPVPVAAQVLVGVVLPLFGLLVLVSEPGQERPAILLFLVTLAGLLCAVRWALSGARRGIEATARSAPTKASES